MTKDRFKRTCLVCGKEYEYCPNCAKYENYPKWMTTFHDDHCRIMMDVATMVSDGSMTVDEAKEQLDGCDISVAKESIRNVLEPLFVAKRDEIITREPEIVVKKSFRKK